ncbi:MAG: peptide deformylase, partial [Pseudomonadota bacterium]
MTVMPILIHPDPRLKKVCDPVGDPKSVEALVANMLDTMYDAPGIGLAAPQVGVNARLLVMDCSAKDEDPDPMVLINPEVLASSEATNVHEEGCLSIPDQFADVTRPAEVTVRWTGPEGDAYERVFDGLWATCV